jgi:hypothetical protein
MLKNFATPRSSVPRPGRPATAAVAAPVDDEPPRADLNGTIVAVIGCALTALFVSGEQPSQLGRFAAIGFGSSLAFTFLVDFKRGLRNLIRADVVALLAFYALTFLEFLFPQPHFDELVTPEMAHNGIVATLLGAVGLLVGRHLWNPRQKPLRTLLTKQVPPGMLLAIFWCCFAVGYFHMLLAVNFNVKEMLRYFVDARFTQPWTRGRLGDWKALVVELGMFIYLLPPLAGIILARRARYGPVSIMLVTCGLLFTLFYGFSSGTRNVLASYLVTVLIGYAFAAGPHQRKEMITLAGVCAVAMLIATPMMLAFRSVGLKEWLSPSYVAPVNEAEQSVFVDYNLYAICEIMDKFPRHRNYLGLEIPYNALIRPIPRALWPSKPEGLTYSIEEALGVEGLTISATFVGEAYMAGGYLAVFAAGLIFGALFGFWNHLGSAGNSELGILVYSSGFFSAVISMRSMFVFTTAMLPTLAAIVLAAFLVKQVVAIERRLARTREMRARQGAFAPQAGKRP